jgi:tetratricopeptide (TPR) repeat protein
VVVETAVRHIDIVPTVLDAIGADPDRALAGTSLREAIAGRDRVDRPTYFEAMTYNLVRGWAPLRGVISGRDKYIDLPIPELYDLAADPREQSNQARAAGGRTEVLLNTLRTYDVAPPGRPGRESAETVAALKSLGYVSGSAPAKAVYTEDDDPKRLAGIDRDLHEATDLLQDGQRDKGIALLRGAIARRPDTADAYIMLAHAYWEGGDPKQAIAALEDGLRAGAPDRDIRIRLGLYLSESGGASSQAIALLKTLPDDDVEAINALGVAYGNGGQYDEAIATFGRILALDPTNGIACQNQASMKLRQALEAPPAQRQARLDEAEALARQAIAIDARLPDAETTLGVVLSTTGRKDQAIEAWERAVALDPQQYNALYNLWMELGAAGRTADAAQYGKQFVDTAPPAFFGPDIERVNSTLPSNASKR